MIANTKAPAICGWRPVIFHIPTAAISARATSTTNNIGHQTTNHSNRRTFRGKGVLGCSPDSCLGSRITKRKTSIHVSASVIVSLRANQTWEASRSALKRRKIPVNLNAFFFFMVRLISAMQETFLSCVATTEHFQINYCDDGVPPNGRFPPPFISFIRC